MTDLTAIKGNERKNKYMNEHHKNDILELDELLIIQWNLGLRSPH